MLKRLCVDGLPSKNYYELCAVYLLEYEKIVKDKKTRNSELKDLVRKSPHKINESNYENQIISEKKLKRGKSNLRKKVRIVKKLVIN